MAKKQTVENFDNDSVWKELLEKYLKEFMEYFFPEAYKEIDWEKGYIFLDKELQKVVRTAIGKRRYLDKLVKVWLKNGEESWVLLHIEVQNQWEEEFSERVYIYQYRIFDRYKRKVATFVVFADENTNWKPSKFEYNLLGTKQLCEYKTVKLLDYKARWDELEKDTNPFSLVVMAHLKVQETKDNEKERYTWKGRLIRELYKRNYSKEDILELFRFIDWLIILPDYLEQKLEEELQETERRELMPFISRIERKWLEQGLSQGLSQGLEQGLSQGLERGRKEGERLIVVRLLKKRLGELDEVLAEKLNALTIDEVEKLGDALLSFQTRADLDSWLASRNS